MISNIVFPDNLRKGQHHQPLPGQAFPCICQGVFLSSTAKASSPSGKLLEIMQFPPKFTQQILAPQPGNVCVIFLKINMALTPLPHGLKPI